MSKITYSVNVGIKTNDPFEHDKMLIDLAKKFEGSSTGSGYGFGARDNSFSFKEEKTLKKFRTSVLRKIPKAKIDVYLTYDNSRTNCYEQMEIEV